MRKRPGRHRAARIFARAVDGSGSPHPSVYRLVSLANALRKAPARAIAPRSSVRQQLMLEAATIQPAAHRPFWTALWEDWLDRIRFQRGLASTTVLCTVLIAAAGIGFGTTESLPGDTLYSMKLRSESVQLAFIGSDEQRGRKNLQFADSRLDEITRLVRHKGDWPTSAKAGKPDAKAAENLINGTFATMDASTGAGAKAMRKAFERTGDISPLTYLDRFIRKQQHQLHDIIPTLPSGSKESASDSLAYVDELNDETAKILGTSCDDGATCSDDETSAANSQTTPPGDPTSESASSSASSSTASGTDGSTSAVPPSSSSGEPTTGTGTGTSPAPTDPGSSTGSGGTAGTPPTSSGGSTTSTQEPSESTSSGTESPSATPPEPTGVPSDTGDSSSTKSDAGAGEEAAEPDDGARQSSPPAESSSAPAPSQSTEPDGAEDPSAADTEQRPAPDTETDEAAVSGDAESTDD